jgi:hypothetical protein
MEIRHPVGRLDDEALGKAEALGEEIVEIGLLQQSDRLSPGRAQLGDRGEIDTRIGRDERGAIRRDVDRVVGIGVSQQFRLRTVEAHPIELPQIGISPGFAATGGEIGKARAGIDIDQIAHDPRSGSDLPLDPAGGFIHEIEMAPSVPLRGPDDFARFAQAPHLAAPGQ